MQSVKVLTYRFDKILNRSIPDKTEKVADNDTFSLREIADIIKAALIMEAPKQVRKVK